VWFGRQASRDRVTGHAYDSPSGADRTIVEVLNASGRSGLARLAARRLRKYGIDAVFFGTARDSTDTTRVILRRGDRSRADQVLKVLGAGTVQVQTDTLLRVDVTVLLGRDYAPDGDGRP
jgi:hypothetical protein